MMKVYQKITFLGILAGLLVIGCVHNKNNIVIEQAKQMLDVQEYTDTISVKYVALETTSECLMGRRIKQVLITDSCIFIVNHQPNLIYMFGRDGRFIRKIGSLGRGPGEYMNVENITVNEVRREIILYDSEICQAMKFDYSGKHLASFSNPASPYGEIIRLNDTLFALQNRSNKSKIPQNPKILILNDSGKIVNTFIPQPEFAGKKMIIPTSSGFFAKNVRGNYYIPYGSDKIYKLSLDGRKNEMVISLDIQDGMLPIDITQEDYEKMSAVKLDPVSNLCITDEGIFTADVNFDDSGVQIIGNLEDKILLAGNATADATAWPGLISARTSYRNYFVGLMSAAEASLFKDKFPNMAEDANPVVIFFKYKLK